MHARVYMAEWQVGDWRHRIETGTVVTWPVRQSGLADDDWLAQIIDPRLARSVTHCFASELEHATGLRGTVTHIRAIRVRYPSIHGGSPIDGSGVVVLVDRARLMSEHPGADGRFVSGYLIDVACTGLVECEECERGVASPVDVAE